MASALVIIVIVLLIAIFFKYLRDKEWQNQKNQIYSEIEMKKKENDNYSQDDHLIEKANRLKKEGDDHLWKLKITKAIYSYTAVR